MDVFLKDVQTERLVPAAILPAVYFDMPLKKEGWNFNWRQLFRVSSGQFYKITLKDSPSRVEGVLLLSVVNDEMLFMNNVEVAPDNYGGQGKLDFVAGCLIAFACRMSFLQGKNY